MGWYMAPGNTSLRALRNATALFASRHAGLLDTDSPRTETISITLPPTDPHALTPVDSY